MISHPLSKDSDKITALVYFFFLKTMLTSVVFPASALTSCVTALNGLTNPSTPPEWKTVFIS